MDAKIVSNKVKEIFASVTRFLNKPIKEKTKSISRRLKLLSTFPFYFGISKIFDIFIAYHPDSHKDFNAHPEFYLLYKRFIRYNRFNNSGDIARLWSFILNIKQIIQEDIQGDFAELGVWRGNTAAILAYYAKKNCRKLYLFDTFEGFDEKDLKGIDSEKQIAFHNTSLGLARETIGENADACVFVKGYFPSSITQIHQDNKYSIVSLDCDLYEPMKAGLDFFYPLLSEGGLLLIHDYSSLCWDGSKKAVDEFCKKFNEHVVLMPDKSGSAFIRKTHI